MNNYYVYLEIESEECYPEDVLGKWGELFNLEMNKYVEKDDNFDVEEDKIVMKEAIEIKEGNLSYKFKYNISHEYPIEAFINVLNTIKANSEECGNSLECWSNKEYEEYTIDVSNDGNLFMFEAVSSPIKSFFGEEEVVFKFAIDYGGL